MAKQVDNEEDESGDENESPPPPRSKRKADAPEKASTKAAPPPPPEEEEEEEDDEPEGDESEESDDASGADDDEDEDDAQKKLDAAVEGATEEAARGELGEEQEEEVAAGQLGIGKYIFSAYLGLGFLITYVLGKTIHDLWAHFANRDWFTKFSAKLAGIPDSDNVFINKLNISLAIGFLIALVIMIRTYRKPSTRQWTDEVTSELAKVRWPTRKDVANSTIVVITASLAATGYLFVLDRLWSFITNLVYGSGT